MRVRRSRLAFRAWAVALLAGFATGGGGAMGSDDGAETAHATFAGGCFWCMEPPFDTLPGVVSTTVGYTGGSQANPTYGEVSAGGTGHVEAVRIAYDPEAVDYAALLAVYWRNVDPLDGGGQFCDRGPSYRPAIFWETPAQHRLAGASKAVVAERFDRPIAVTVEEAGRFWPAEEYHRDFYKKNPVRYHQYKFGCGRAERLDEVWGDQPPLPFAAGDDAATGDQATAAESR